MNSKEILPLKTTLTPIHRTVIAMHVKGKSFVEIGKTLHLSANKVRKILTTDVAQEIIGEIASLHRLELAALTMPAIEAVRRNLESAHGNTALKAADMVLNTQGLYKEPESQRVTAEDVITRALEVVQANGVRLRVIEQIGSNQPMIEEAH